MVVGRTKEETIRPENLLREARRQKGLRAKAAPSICILDPDGDIVRYLVTSGRARPEPAWPCYHTALHVLDEQRQRLGIVSCAVGAPFAVLIGEELFASGCELLISITSAGEIVRAGEPPRGSCMAAYVITYLEVTDPEAFQAYRRAAGPTFAPYGGKPIVVDGRFEILEGMLNPKSVVVIEFESAEQARRWYTSPEYARTIPLRQRSASAILVLVEGLSPSIAAPHVSPGAAH